MAPAPTTQFLLHGEDRVWLVETGPVDLFLVDLEDGRPSGPLHPLWSVSSGEAMSGAGPIETEGRLVGIWCRPGPDAVVRLVDDDGAAAALRASWQYRLAEEAFPREVPTGLEAENFHRAALLALRRRRQAGEEREAERLHAKEVVRTALVEEALQRLSSIIGSRARGAQQGGVDETSRLLAACRIVARQLNIEIRLPSNFALSGDVWSDIAKIARASGVRHRMVILRGRWWTEDAGPLLAFRDSADGPAGAIALLPRRNRYYMHSGHGSHVRVDASLAGALARRAVMFYRPFPLRPLRLRDLLLFATHGVRGDVSVMIAAGALVGVLALALPVATGILFDTIIPGSQRSQLYQLSVLLFSANLTSFFVSLTSSLAVQRMEGRVEPAVQAAVWDRLLGLPAKFFRQFSSGDLVERSLAIGQIRQMLTTSAIQSLLTGIFSIFSFALLFRYSGKLAIVATVLAAVAASVSGACGWAQVRYQREIHRAAGRISAITLELMNGIAKLRIAGAEPHAFARWAAEFAAQKSVAARAARVSAAMTVFHTVFGFATAIAIYYFGFGMMEAGSPLTPGGFVAFHAAFGQFLGAALGLATTAISIAAIVPLYERATPILRAVPETQGARSDPGELQGAVELSRISFRYREDGPLVLNDVSLQIKPGQFVAFVGPSGSGKSTLFRLLLGFEKAESGSIYYDGADLFDIDPQALRAQLGVVLQNSRTLDGSIYSNIVGATPLQLEHAWRAARAVGLDQDIQSMPMGMDTVVSEGGGGLSGGQRQRLLIARAIVHHPRILLFDEATSALDNQTQAIVSRSLEELKATRIVIAHRLSTIRNADLILVFDQGRIVQQGRYDELIGREGLFRVLAERQVV